MLTRRIRIWTGLALVAFGAILVAASACDLNPQPLPPGLQSPSAGEFDDAGAASPVVGAADAGGTAFAGGDGGDAEATLPVTDGAGDGGDAGISDGGDGGDAEETDSSTDAPGDAE